MLAHLCRECGTDLAVVRAIRDPEYGLMIARCPTCASVSVRQRSPVLRRWRALRRADWALTVLALNAVLLGLLLLAIVGPSFWISHVCLTHTPAELWTRDPIAVVTALLVFPVVAGVWLTAGLGHWRRAAAFVTFTALAAAAFAVIAAVQVMDGRSHPGPAALRLAVPLEQLRLNLALLVLLMLVATLGIPPGLGLRRMLSAGRRARWRWRKRRMRAERG